VIQPHAQQGDPIEADRPVERRREGWRALRIFEDGPQIPDAKPCRERPAQIEAGPDIRLEQLRVAAASVACDVIVVDLVPQVPKQAHAPGHLIGRAGLDGISGAVLLSGVVRPEIVGAVSIRLDAADLPVDAVLIDAFIDVVDAEISSEAEAVSLLAADRLAGRSQGHHVK